MNNLFKGAALFIGGALVGAAAAMLLTPKNGEEVRKELADLALEAKKRAQDYCEQVKEQVKEEVEKHFPQTAHVAEPVAPKAKRAPKAKKEA